MRWRQYKIARERMVREHVWARGIRDPRVIESMLRVPRHLFIGHDAGIEAYADHSYPIGFRQTMSQPYMVAYLSEQLRLDGDERVLEIGTGSGFMAALLSHKAQSVTTLEIRPALVQMAQENLRRAGIANVSVRQADGAQGLAVEAPFDVIMLSGAVALVPQLLLDQLRIGGRLLGIVGNVPVMRAVRITRLTEGSFQTVELFDTVAPPLQGFEAPTRFSF